MPLHGAAGHPSFPGFGVLTVHAVEAPHGYNLPLVETVRAEHSSAGAQDDHAAAHAGAAVVATTPTNALARQVLSIVSNRVDHEWYDTLHA